MSIIPEMKKKTETKGSVLEQMYNSGSTTTTNNNQKQTLLIYKNISFVSIMFMACASYFDLSGKLGNISGEKHIRCPICWTGRIIESQPDA